MQFTYKGAYMLLFKFPGPHGPYPIFILMFPLILHKLFKNLHTNFLKLLHLDILSHYVFKILCFAGFME